MKVDIEESVYKKLKAYAEKDNVDINIVASVLLQDALRERMKLKMDCEVYSSPHKEIIERWLM